MGKKKAFERAIEKFLWHYRLIIILGIFSLLSCSAIVFFLGLAETFFTIKMFVSNMIQYHGHIKELAYNDLIVQIITIIDDFLLGIVLLIFGLGTYDLFISRLDPAEEQDDIRPDWLVFESLDELKNVLAKVIMMIMTITFLKYMTKAEFSQPLEILYLGGGLALVGLAIKLSHNHENIRSERFAHITDGPKKAKEEA